MNVIDAILMVGLGKSPDQKLLFEVSSLKFVSFTEEEFYFKALMLSFER